MKPIICYCFLWFVLFISCNPKQEIRSSDIIIEGKISGVPDGKIFLVESRKWKSPIDSTIITNGNFIFKINPSSTFSPFLAAIHYWNETNVTRLRYRNHTLDNDSLNFYTDAFYLEPGTIKIAGNNNNIPYLRIYAGNENELLFKNQFEDFGWIGNLDSIKRLEKINNFKKSIQQNSSSYFLLESIYRSKEQYVKEELTTLFFLFNKDVRQSKEGNAFQKYIAIRPNDNASLPNLSLLTPNNNVQNIINPTAKINMLVFWASWCAPCRKEIPLLKAIQKKFSSVGLQITSISIDEKKENWLHAVAQEKMDWPQVHVPLEKIDAVQNQFRFITIPLIIFTDNNGREIKRFADYDPDHVTNYESLINNYIQ